MPLPEFEPIPFGVAVEQKPSMEVLDRLWHRRSAPAVTLQEPGPSPDEMEMLIRIGLRVPDHGKIGPWRVVRFTPESKAALVERLIALAEARGERKDVAALQKLAIPPEALLVVSSPAFPYRKPLWEQQLSAAAVCQNMLIAAGALGYGANWITDWYSYDDEAKAILGLTEGENVAGWILLGTPAEPPLERERPDYGSRIGWWEAK